jgi:RNA polymerase sigma factor (sigma-70 family)
VTVFFETLGLLEAFRRGERAALTTVYYRYVDDVAALVRRGFSLEGQRGAIRGIVEPDRQRDLVQEVFLRCFSEQARRSYDGVSPFRPYLMRITKNLMIDEARRAGRFVAAPEDGGDAPGPPPELSIPSPEDELEWRYLREQTRAYCATLSETLQRFIALRFEEEHSQRDVAAALQVTRRKVRTWERQVRAGLRRHLNKLRRRPKPTATEGSTSVGAAGSGVSDVAPLERPKSHVGP